MPEMFEFPWGFHQLTTGDSPKSQLRDFAGAGASQLKRYDGGFHNLLAEPKLKDQAEVAKGFLFRDCRLAMFSITWYMVYILYNGILMCGIWMI